MPVTISRWAEFVAHQSPAAIIGQLVGMGAEPPHLGFDGLPQ
jgi:hypothetical protein